VRRIGRVHPGYPQVNGALFALTVATVESSAASFSATCIA
jgi:hypothetical protein